jgi:hypothetical protein
MTTQPQKTSFILFIGIVCLALMLLAFLLLRPKGESGPSSPDKSLSTSNTASSSQSTATKSILNLLEGKWARTDGDYVIVIGSADADGRVVAAYFNPQPIKVSRASAKEHEGKAQLFMELQDVGYPGCTYNLTLNQETGQLYGQYFQAAMRETYEVVFQRLK